MLKFIESTSNILKNLKFALYIKYLLKESISGIVIAAAVAAATLLVNNYTAIAAEGDKLSKVHLGLSEQYIESILGTPMVRQYDNMSETEIAYYKLDNSVTWCAYDKDDKVVAYVITTNTRRNMYLADADSYLEKPIYLGKFSYCDFSDDVQQPLVNNANNYDFSYYYEIYKSSWDDANEHYYLVGTYQDRFNDTDFAEIMDTIVSYQIGDVSDAELDQMRSKLCPNTFGMIVKGYHDQLGIIPFNFDRTYSKALYW